MSNSENYKKKKNVSYITNPSLIKACDKITNVFQRASMVHSLIEAYGLTSLMKIIEPIKASEEDIRIFHSEDYVDELQSAIDESDEDEFGLGFDCPIFEDIWSVVQELAGATNTAADALINGDSDIAINWCGGWHHAQRDSASGFCYINDIVISIQKLRRKFDKILYIDLDIHHGDGVENAFLLTHKVLTLSLHQQEAGFFPGTGSEDDVGFGRGVNYTVNMPYKEGINDTQFIFLFESVIYDIFAAFDPDAIICQCGGDTLAGDPLGGANVTLNGYLVCIKNVLSLNRPTLFLGGGGYNKPNTAKLWTAITFTILDIPLPEDIPEHEFFPLYGPDFQLEVSRNLRKSYNTDDSIKRTILNVLQNILAIKPLTSYKNSSDIEARINILENSLKMERK